MGALVYLGMILFSYGLVQIPWWVRRVGIMGVVIIASSLVGYPLAHKVRYEGVWSSRYLAALVWVLHYILIPLAERLKPLRSFLSFCL
ncbi:hypothetical protein [Pajaroellobacter abortibovis]|uniref:Uncharacterized protein n=1 Tax=Pajaroellobacter abortibovis TaxID=1882918 RepID=A0A1L6MYX3_9BACT|nr:hypothetical protein [Pajaroellobacter abortibovis]APS00791.1 hypothetical protein BCY86_08945 [Pajaroellobacter abortibovis]